MLKVVTPISDDTTQIMVVSPLNSYGNDWISLLDIEEDVVDA